MSAGKFDIRSAGAAVRAVLEGVEADVSVNVLLVSLSSVIGKGTPGFRAQELTRSIVFLIGEAQRMGIELDDLGRYCRQLATDRERTFFDEPAN